MAADADAIQSLTRDAYRKWVPLIGREPLPMTVDYRIAVTKHRFDLLFVQDKLAALIETIPAPDHLLIENLAVQPGSQGNGYGTRLLYHTEQTAADDGVMEIRLYTNAMFSQNVRFYQQYGYSIDREEPFQGGTMVHMCKRLNAT